MSRMDRRLSTGQWYVHARVCSIAHYRSAHEGIKYPCNQCDYHLQTEVIFRDIFSLNTKVSSSLVISVIIKLQIVVIFRNIFSESTNSTDHRCFFRPGRISHHNRFFHVLRNKFSYPVSLSRLLFNSYVVPS